MNKERDDIVVHIYSKKLDSFIKVERADGGLYNVLSRGDVTHPNCTAEDVMRVLGHYLSGT